MITKSSIISRDLDAEAQSKLSNDLYKIYLEKTSQARSDWQKAQTIYSHITRRPYPSKDGQTWGLPERQAASRFLEYQQALWSVFLSLRTGTSPSKQNEKS